jgi:hypothetical protein
MKYWNFLIFLANANLKLTYALSTSSAKVITYQSFDVEVILNIISSIDFKNIFLPIFNTLKKFKLCIQHILNSIFKAHNGSQ